MDVQRGCGANYFAAVGRFKSRPNTQRLVKTNAWDTTIDLCSRSVSTFVFSLHQQVSVCVAASARYSVGQVSSCVAVNAHKCDIEMIYNRFV